MTPKAERQTNTDRQAGRQADRQQRQTKTRQANKDRQRREANKYRQTDTDRQADRQTKTDKADDPAHHRTQGYLVKSRVNAGFDALVVELGKDRPVLARHHVVNAVVAVVVKPEIEERRRKVARKVVPERNRGNKTEAQ